MKRPNESDGAKDAQMTTALKIAPKDKYVTVDGLKTRYIEEGTGPALLFLHGASLGSSADVFIRNMGPFAKAGFRAIAVDMPGYGLTDTPTDHSAAYRRNSLPMFLDALGLKKVAFVAHSQAGGMAVQLALADPSRYSHIYVLGNGSLLPPLQAKDGEGKQAAVQQRLERRMSTAEPTLADTRKLLEANLFHHELITDEELALRHSRSVGKCFEAFVARQDAAAAAPAKKAPSKPMWERLTELKMPLLMLYGREDRGNAGERAALLKQLRPEIDVHVVSGCKHLVPWDAADEVVRLGVPFLKS
jgi:pimeloyl-ACP methyl ester carboxylesterase